MALTHRGGRNIDRWQEERLGSAIYILRIAYGRGVAGARKSMQHAVVGVKGAVSVKGCCGGVMSAVRAHIA